MYWDLKTTLYFKEVQGESKRTNWSPFTIKTPLWKSRQLKELYNAHICEGKLRIRRRLKSFATFPLYINPKKSESSDIFHKAY